MTAHEGPIATVGLLAEPGSKERVVGVKPVTVEHQLPERSLLPLKAGMRRHIQTEYTILGRVSRREWWWEPDREPCSTGPIQRPLPPLGNLKTSGG